MHSLYTHLHTPVHIWAQPAAFSLKPHPVSYVSGLFNTRGCGLLFASVAKKCSGNGRLTSAVPAVHVPPGICLFCFPLAKPALFHPGGAYFTGEVGVREGARTEHLQSGRNYNPPGMNLPPQRAVAGPEGVVWK